MIFTEIGQSRKMVGNLDRELDVIGSLKDLCKHSGIHCGHIRAVGYVKDPELRRYSQSQSAYLDAEIFKGVYQLTGCEGFLSLGETDADDADLMIHTVAAASGVGRNKVVVGQLVGGAVIQFEFLIEVFDSISLRRMHDPATGLGLWLQAMPTGTAVAEDPTVLPTLKDPEIKGGRAEPEEIELDEIELERGDWLDHPRLGQCQVLARDNDERVPVKLPSGRVAELHLGLFRMFRIGRKQGGTVYKVEVRRKKT
jgi:predicted DNA-binding protein with PD1-like motif